MDVVETAPHEFTANLIYDEYGLDPYFAADAQIKAGNGKQEAVFEAHNETWEATLYYQNSGIQPPTGGHTPNGTTWTLEQTREYRLQVTATDSVGKRRFNAHISPRWKGMKVKKRNGDITTLLLAMAEEHGELAQAYLQWQHEDGDGRRIADELDDLAALCIQLRWRLEDQ